jgi:hypothetical protein
MSQPPFGQERHRGFLGLGRDGRDNHLVRLCCFPRFQRDRVSGQSAGSNGSSEPGDQMLVGHVTAQQQDLDQGPGAVPVAVGLAGRRPPGVVDRSEPSR